MGVFGVWMWPCSIQQRGAEKVVSWCARAKVTDIFFLVKGLAGKTACRGSFAPQVCERDLLEELLNAAHARGIRVHAWFTSASDANYKQLHPESGRYHFTRGRDKGLISLDDEAYMRYMESIIREVCRNYDIDGLHLDYIRYNHVMYGWSPQDLERYAAEGADTDFLCSLLKQICETKDETPIMDACRAGNESVRALVRARRKDIVRFASRMIQAAKAEKSSLILTAALLPEGAYEDTTFADLHYGQNYQDALQLYDYVLPMAYSQAYRQNGQWVKEQIERTVQRGLKTVAGLHAYEGGTGLSLQEDMEALKDSPIEGICLFREGATAMAFASAQEVCICNALDETITGVRINGELTVESAIQPGQQQEMAIGEPVRTVQVFCGEKERCVYLVHE